MTQLSEKIFYEDIQFFCSMLTYKKKTRKGFVTLITWERELERINIV